MRWRATARRATPNAIWSAASSTRSAATTAPAPASSTCCASRSTRSTPPAIADRREDATLEAEEDAARRRGSPPRRLWPPRSTPRGPGARRGRRERRARRSRPGPFAELASRLRACRPSWPSSPRPAARARGAVSEDPDRLDEVRARRQLLRELSRKYGETLAEVRRLRRRGRPAGWPSSRATRSGPPRSRPAVAELGPEERAGGARACRAPGSRPPAGSRPAVTEHLGDLAMPAAPLRGAGGAGSNPDWGEDGADRVTFLLAANPGEPARPLAKAARAASCRGRCWRSGSCCSEAPPTLVFDEVDAGIGGEAGTAVGRLLADLAGRHQVLCVTHLAQVAAFADAQVVVEKAGTREPDGGHGGGRGGRRTRGRSSPGCSRASATRRTPAATRTSCSTRPRAGRGSWWRAVARRLLRRQKAEPAVRRDVVGQARVGRRTKDLVKRLEPGDIAVINHPDLDRVAAESLIAAGVAAVVNADVVDLGPLPERRPDPDRRGGHPAARRRGQRMLLDASSRTATSCASSAARSGRRRRDWSPPAHVLDAPSIESRDGGRPGRRSAPSSSGSPSTRSSTSSARRSSRSSRSSSRRSRRKIKGRHALVVVRGHDYRDDLAALRPYIREYRPVLDRRRRRRRRAARDRLQARHHHRRLRLGLRARAGDRRASWSTTCTSTGARRDARTCSTGASRTTSSSSTAPARTSPCSSPTRPARSSSSPSAPTRRWSSSSTRAGGGMSSTFLTRLRLGPVLVDAKGVSRLYEGRVRRRDMAAARRVGARGDDRRHHRVGADPRVPPRHPGDARGPLALDHATTSDRRTSTGPDDQLPLPHRVAGRGLPRARARRRHGLDGHRPRHRRQPQRPARHASSGTRADDPEARTTICSS